MTQIENTETQSIQLTSYRNATCGADTSVSSPSMPLYMFGDLDSRILYDRDAAMRSDIRFRSVFAGFG